MKKPMAFIAAALALVLILTCLPFSVLAKTVTPRWTVPEGYNEHDYNKCAAFLEQTDGNGVKNGEKLSETYDPNDPETWGTYYDHTEQADLPRFQWSADGSELKIAKIDLYNSDYNDPWQLMGSLDLGGCAALVRLDCYGNALTALDLAGCAALETLYCGYNALTAPDLSGCTALRLLDCSGNGLTALDLNSFTALTDLNCNYNALTALDVSSCIGLKYLKCSGNALTRLELTSNPELRTLYCSNGALTALDLSHNPELTTVSCLNDRLKDLILPAGFPVQRLRAEGNGCIGCAFGQSSGFTAYAYVGEDAAFIGWYDETGAHVSDEEQLHVVSDSFSELTARFEGGEIPGDMNGDGAVDIGDALSILRAAMGLVTATPGQIAACDMDGDGMLTVADALQVMRMSMGLA